VLHLAPRIAPVKVAVFPLVKKEPLFGKAKEIFDELQMMTDCEFDISGAIGKRYRRQDELGTPFCITVDFETLEDDTVTLRDRDTMKQERVPVKELASILLDKLR
jgi:glycyl-tRNA synthetase